MTNLFEDPNDSRQAQTGEAISKFRTRYRALTEEEKQLHDAIKTTAEQLDSLFASLPAGTYQLRAFESLEVSVMWAIKQLTA